MKSSGQHNSHNSSQHRSLTLAFELFRVWLRICGDIHSRKSTPGLGESGSCRLPVSVSRGLPASMSRGVAASPYRQVGESAIKSMRSSLDG
jgi:hypothetical protein